jgi:hypothetical protein
MFIPPPFKVAIHRPRSRGYSRIQTETICHGYLTTVPYVPPSFLADDDDGFTTEDVSVAGVEAALGSTSPGVGRALCAGGGSSRAWSKVFLTSFQKRLVKTSFIRLLACPWYILGEQCRVLAELVWLPSRRGQHLGWAYGVAECQSIDFPIRRFLRRNGERQMKFPAATSVFGMQYHPCCVGIASSCHWSCGPRGAG